MLHNIKAGQPYPLGCTQQMQDGVKGYNFALYSEQASAVELCLFDQQGTEIRFPLRHKQDNIWHIWLADIPLGTLYGYRISAENGRTLANPKKLILDPYAKAVQGKPDLSTAEKRAWFDLQDPRDNAALAPKGVIIDEAFDWQGDKPLCTAWSETVIYELNVKGFSQLKEDLPEAIRGTYTALAHPTMIAYLQSLGVSAVELLPVNYFVDEVHLQQKGLCNFWGYNPLAMFAVEPKYAQNPQHALNEFKQMVKALHQAGIEVILDVVFNHTAESEKHFPSFSQRGIDDRTYYWQNEQGQYYNWTGCGNTLNLSKPITRRWVIDCLRYWVEECHIDGFRFDLGAILGREGEGGFNPKAQLFAEMMNVPSLQQCKFIAEPWDIGDFGYQVGNFPPFFAEWNDRFRDDITCFWLHQSGQKGAFAQRFAGSSEIFQASGRLPHHSINFITAHDGFTLQDLLSYSQKYNWANGEDNRDGRNENHSYNHGFEGVENVPSAVQKSRNLSRANLLASLLLANGTPMLLAGDEFGNSQLGNNNAYCQDNKIAWLKWHQFDAQCFTLTQQLIQLRKKIALLKQDSWWNENQVQWLTAKAEAMTVADWHCFDCQSWQILLQSQWLILLNGHKELHTFQLPDGDWKVVYSATEVNLQQNQCELTAGTLALLQKITN